jgi:hypothetical protein
LRQLEATLIICDKKILRWDRKSLEVDDVIGVGSVGLFMECS